MARKIANGITFFRIAGSVVMLFFPVFSIGFYTFYLLCGISDMIDGKIARTSKEINVYGAVLDSLADFVFLVLSFVKLISVIRLPLFVWIWVALIALVKIGLNVYSLIYFDSLLSLHTLLNRITGILMFIFPFVILLVDVKYVSVALCVSATFAVIGEAIYVKKGTAVL